MPRGETEGGALHTVGLAARDGVSRDGAVDRPCGRDEQLRRPMVSSGICRS
ncbi:MAG: hypothetical protein AVDCRST_MAG19-2852 [uncultured Thermomicrobiales bacterium]|uniref:Uncharacterized protein n=1 Tax=uncultured Thermomicrobiales bacterium TaxID=1645740 RepID=A0A6J4VAC4_9BACT|nr:MAG: hypothetical protein AVDCRST_MAG19-2852 [uncultured Thermomicrobiales bacterium]